MRGFTDWLKNKSAQVKTMSRINQVVAVSCGLVVAIAGYIIVVSNAADTAPAPSTKPFVKLFSQGNGAAPTNTDTAATDLAKYYVHIHGEGSNPSSFTIKNSGLGAKLIDNGVWSSQYRNGSYVSQANGGPTDSLFIEANDLERNAPLAIGTFWPGDFNQNQTNPGAATLQSSLSATATTLQLAAPSTKPSGTPAYWPYMASKDGNGDNYSNSTADYIAWIRVDNEIIQITATPTVSSGTITLNLKRGIWGSTAASHASGVKVFSPAYIGSTEMNGTPSLNDANKPLRYTLQFWLPAGYQWQADRILKTLGDGKSVAQGGKMVHYDTVWLDVSSCNQYNVADPYANGIQMWDPLGGIRMTKDNWGKYQEWKLRGQNNAGGGLRDLVKYQNSAVPIKFTGNSLLKASGDACNEKLLGSVYDGGTLEGWLKGDFNAQMKLTFDIQKNNWPGLFWVRHDAGYGGEVPFGKPVGHKRFTYGGYLLAYNAAAAKPQFGMTWGFVKPENLFFYDLGTANKTTLALTDVATSNSNIYVREFSKGLVVVNAGDTAQTYTLPRQLYRVSGTDETSVDVTPVLVSGTVTINPKDAMFLMNPVTTGTTDTTAPSTPTNLTSSNVTATSATINWTASTDNVGVSGYNIYRGGTQVGTSTATSYADSGLTASTTYQYTVRARDAAGNLSAASTALSVTTTSGSTGGTSDSTGLCGTWALQQVASTTELENYRTPINNALDIPGTIGFSVRFAWNNGDITGTATSNAILDKALDIVNDYNAAHPGANKQLSIRFMAGRHTPQRVWDAGAAYFTDGTSTKNPLPWDGDSAAHPTTGGDHDIWLAEYDKYLGKLVSWARTNKVKLVHLSWWAMDWAELNHGKEVRGENGHTTGYTYDKWLTGHKQLLDVGAKYAADDITVEVPLSGYGPLSSGQSASLADHIVTKVGQNTYKFMIQANGWGPNGEWGASDPAVETQMDDIWTRPLHRGLQMIQPYGYDWSVVFQRLYDNKATYAEVYLPSFYQIPGPNGDNTQEKIDELKAEIPKFAQTCSTTPSPTDTQAPSTPTSLTSPSQTASSISLSWPASTDNVGVTGYKVFRNGTQVGTSNTTSYTDSGLTASTAYSYRVSAYDAAGNNSAQSTALTVSTKAAADTLAPTAPSNLNTTSVQANSVGLTWTASTDNVGVVKYLVQRNNVTIAEPTGTSYTDTTVAANTTYNYVVRAVDAAGNVSTASNTKTVTTPNPADTSAPTTPTNLSATASSSSQVSLTWTASTDNIGVTGYRIYRGGVQVGTSTTTSYGDTGLTASTSYNYTVRAYDAAGNLSPASATASATTLAPPITGDLNSDGKVNVFDLSILLSKWGTSDAAADLNRNGTVDVFDLSILLSSWTG